MPIDPSEQARRVADFKADLVAKGPLFVTRKHITTGSSAVLTDADYYDLRQLVADEFRLHPSAVILVGSCRTGFSLKPHKRYAPFGDDSDIDLAIVSREKFNQYWDLVFDQWRVNQRWGKTRRYRLFLSELFKGWIWPRRLPPYPNFRDAIKWVEFEDTLTKKKFGGLRSVGARLYPSWERLEAYQSIHVIECKNALPREKNDQ